MCKLDLANNRNGIQGHSQGSVFPIVKYIVDSDNSARQFRSLSPWGVELSADNEARQAENSRYLLRLEKLADKACKQLFENGGFSLDQNGKSPTEGFVVSYPNSETIVSPHRPYNRIYQKFHACWDNLAVGCYIGGWIFKDMLYLDVSDVYVTRDVALLAGKMYHQLAIYDVVNQEVIPC